MTPPLLRPMDAVVTLAAVALVIALYLRPWSESAPASQAVVWVAGETAATLPLNQSRRLRVEGPLGESVVEVRGGRVRVADSPGRQQLCVKAGWLAQAGESAVCLPNQVVVRVRGRDPRFDSVNF